LSVQPAPADAVIWHDAECGSYAADLSLWEELAEGAGGTVAELGCGTGRVALHLARRGHQVVGVELDPELAATLEERGRGLALQTVVADARSFELPDPAGLVLATMQFLQLLPDSDDRVRCLHRVAEQLLPGGRFAAAIVEAMPEPDDSPPPLPDVREVDGWVYSSLPIDAMVGPDAIVVRRLRQTVSPAGELDEEPNEIRLATFSADRLQLEAEAVGLTPVERRWIEQTDVHVGSLVSIFERAA
jgi:SAM-dependent methyltransferase